MNEPLITAKEAYEWSVMVSNEGNIPIPYEQLSQEERESWEQTAREVIEGLKTPWCYRHHRYHFDADEAAACRNEVQA